MIGQALGNASGVGAGPQVSMLDFSGPIKERKEVLFRTSPDDIVYRIVWKERA